MRLGASQVVLVVLCAGCSNLLGADFDPEDVETRRLSVTLPESPTASVSGSPSTGSGRVVSVDGRIECGTTCNAEYPLGAEAVLEAQPDEGSAFAGWRSSSCNNERGPSCTVTLSESTEVEAYFVNHGANIWRFPVPGAGTESLPNLGIAVRKDGESYAFGTFDQQLILPGVELANAGQSDLFLLHLDANGALVPNDSNQVPARTIGSAFSESSSGIALASTGPVVIANSTSADENAWAEIIPLGQAVSGASNGIIVGYDENLGVRWTAVTQGAGDQTFDFLAVDDDDRIYVLGTTQGQMDLGGKGTESLDGVDVVLARFDANGSPEIVDNLLGVTPIALSTLRDSDEILVAAEPFEPSGIFKSCPPAKFTASAQYVARLDSLEGICVDLLTFPEFFALRQVLTTADDRVILIGYLLDGMLEFDPSDEDAKVTADENGAYVAVLLSDHLQWMPGESWIQRVTGISKLGAAGVGRELVLSWSATTDTFVGDVLVPYQIKRSMIFVALGLDGQMLWHRSFGAVQDSAASQITWNEPSSTWFLATTTQSTQPAHARSGKRHAGAGCTRGSERALRPVRAVSRNSGIGGRTPTG